MTDFQNNLHGTVALHRQAELVRRRNFHYTCIGQFFSGLFRLLGRDLLRHGADRVLFASDSPWDSQKDYVAILKSFRLGEEAEEMLFHRNAESILRGAGIAI